MKCYFVILIIISHVVYCHYVGDNCTTKDGLLEGICTEVTKCEPALIAIRNKIFNQFSRCGFRDREEVVCCPRTTTKFGGDENEYGNENSRITSERISVRECKRIIANTTTPLSTYILGGEVAENGEFPHMAALVYERGNGYEFDCGGSVLSSTFVLTAAHCVDTLDRIEPTVVRAGVINIGGKAWNPQTDVRIAQIIINPQYNRLQKYHDLALLKLENPLSFSPNLNAICLETNEEDPEVPLTITGWGKTSNTRDTRSNILLKTNVTAVSRDECNDSYKNWRKLPKGIAADQLCAGDPRGISDACQGDSGGPLVTVSKEGQNRLVGVTSFGRGCGSPVPGVYVRVSSYLDWIESVVWPN